MEKPSKYRIVQRELNDFIIEGYYETLTAKHKTFFGWQNLIFKNKWEPLSFDFMPRETYMKLSGQCIPYTEEYCSPWRMGSYISLEEAEDRIEKKKNPFVPKEIKVIQL